MKVLVFNKATDYVHECIGNAAKCMVGPAVRLTCLVLVLGLGPWSLSSPPLSLSSPASLASAAAASLTRRCRLTAPPLPPPLLQEKLAEELLDNPEVVVTDKAEDAFDECVPGQDEGVGEGRGARGRRPVAMGPPMARLAAGGQ